MVGKPSEQVLVRVSLKVGAAQCTGWRMALWAESRVHEKALKTWHIEESTKSLLDN